MDCEVTAPETDKALAVITPESIAFEPDRVPTTLTPPLVISCAAVNTPVVDNAPTVATPLVEKEPAVTVPVAEIKVEATNDVTIAALAVRPAVAESQFALTPFRKVPLDAVSAPEVLNSDAVNGPVADIKLPVRTDPVAEMAPVANRLAVLSVVAITESVVIVPPVSIQADDRPPVAVMVLARKLPVVVMLAATIVPLNVAVDAVSAPELIDAAVSDPVDK
jgi:hypothetical protein